MISYYKYLLDSSVHLKDLEAAKETIAHLKVDNSNLKKACEDYAKKLERAVRLERECNEARVVIKAHEEKLGVISSEKSFLRPSSLSIRQELTFSKAKHEELTLKYDAFLQHLEHDMRPTASLARKEIKCHGQILIH